MASLADAPPLPLPLHLGEALQCDIISWDFASLMQ